MFTGMAWFYMNAGRDHSSLVVGNTVDLVGIDAGGDLKVLF